MADVTEIDRQLRLLDTELKRLETEYTMYFANRVPRPPWETRRRVETIIRRWDRVPIAGSAERFRFQTLRLRFATFAELWDRAMRAREEGRQGPFSRARPDIAGGRPEPADRVVYAASFADPATEGEKLHELYLSLCEARRQVGQPNIPFHRFADVVRDECAELRAESGTEVTFRVAVKEGRVLFSAWTLRDRKELGEEGG